MVADDKQQQQQQILSLLTSYESRHGRFTLDDLRGVLGRLGSMSGEERAALLAHVERLADRETGKLSPRELVAWLFADSGPASPERTADLAPASGEYTSADSIKAALLTRSVILVDCKYFAKAHAAGRLLEPRQVIERDFPEFVISDIDSDKLVVLKVDDLGRIWMMDMPSEGGTVVVAVSYGWLASSHPDPEGYHLKNIKGLVMQFMSVLCKYNLRLALFFDYCSLYQKPKTEEQKSSFQRTDAQEALFKVGLNNVNLWYAHQMVQVWLLRNVPPGSANPTPYDDRGWTTFEKLISAWVSFLMFDFGELGEADPALMPPFLVEEAPKLYCVLSEQLQSCRTGTSVQQPPPTQPAVFNDVIAQKKFTNGKTDEAQVRDLYARTFGEVMQAATSLSYVNKSWNDDMALRLADVLAECAALEELTLSENPIGDAGVLACIERCRPLTKLGLAFTQITDKSVSYIATACKGLTHLRVHDTQLTDLSIRVISERCRWLQHVDLSNTQVSDESIVLLARSCPGLMCVNLVKTQVTDTSVSCLAQCCTGLTMLSLKGTRITDVSASLLVHCKDLGHLELDDTQVSDASLHLLAQHCRKMQVCHLGGLRLTDTSITLLAEACPGLMGLILSKTQITDASVVGLAEHCKGIFILNLAGTSVTDASMGVLAQQCPKLTALFLDDTQITDTSVCLVAKHLKNLATLDLDNTRVTDLSIEHVTQCCPTLSRLSIRNTRVTDASVIHVALKLCCLSSLGLNRDQVSEECRSRLLWRTGLTITES